MKVLKFLFANNGIKKKKLIIFGILQQISKVFIIIIPIMLSKYVIDSLVHKKDIKEIIIFLALVIALYILILILNTYAKQMYVVYVVKFRFDFLKLVGTKSTKVAFKNLEDKSYLKLLEASRIYSSNNSSGIAKYMFNLADIFGLFFTLIMYIIFLTSINWGLLIISIPIFCISTLTNMKISSVVFLSKKSIIELEREKEYFRELIYDYRYAKELRLYEFDIIIINKIHDLVCNIKVETNRYENYKLKYRLVNNFFLLAFNACVVSYLIYGLNIDSLTLGSFTIGVSIIIAYSLAVNTLAEKIGEFKNNTLEITDMADFFALSNEYISSDGKIIDEIKKISFHDVSFKYPNGSDYVLNNVNFEISCEDKVAIVGLNGAGKTTLIKLLMKLYTPTSGEIKINGIDINEINTRSYQELISSVFQDVHLYPFSVAENITLSEISSEEKITKSLDKVLLASKINKLENGVQTNTLKLTEQESIDFSGGEKQRISIARALYKTGSLYILDEPNAALDPSTEQQIMDNVFEQAKGNILIFISHRLITTMKCDKILVLDDGKIIENGSHKQLIKLRGKYYQLFKSTADMYYVGGVYEKHI